MMRQIFNKIISKKKKVLTKPGKECESKCYSKRAMLKMQAKTGQFALYWLCIKLFSTLLYTRLYLRLATHVNHLTREGTEDLIKL